MRALKGIDAGDRIKLKDRRTGKVMSIEKSPTSIVGTPYSEKECKIVLELKEDGIEKAVPIRASHTLEILPKHKISLQVLM